MKYLALLILFVSCKSDSHKLFKYRCTSEQLELVNKEVTRCATTGYTSDFCFKQAKFSQCDYIGKERDNDEN